MEQVRRIFGVIRALGSRNLVMTETSPPPFFFCMDVIWGYLSSLKLMEIEAMTFAGYVMWPKHII